MTQESEDEFLKHLIAWVKYKRHITDHTLNQIGYANTL